MKKKKNNKGFSLMAVMVAVGILVVSFLAIISLMASTIKYGALAEQKIIAIGLAQEGIELVRNIRDTNILNKADFDDDLGDGDYYIDYENGNLTSTVPASNPNLKLNNGFYQYSFGPDTPYKRLIKISSASDYIEVTSEVTWNNGSIKLVNRLYDWRN